MPIGYGTMPRATALAAFGILLSCGWFSARTRQLPPDAPKKGAASAATAVGTPDAEQFFRSFVKVQTRARYPTRAPPLRSVRNAKERASSSATTD